MPATPRKSLPIGIQTLSEIIQDGHYYVDKTGFAQRLISRGKYYFLARPRRFGKSLFLDTLKEIFEGNQSLFTGLHIANHWDWSRPFPVLRISFGGSNIMGVPELTATLHQQLEAHERRFGLPARYPDNHSRFADLIERLHQHTGQRVVVLVDEYDKPILDRIEQPEIACAIREELKNLYSMIKEQDAHIRFAFLTGVSKFTKVSLFSGLNNLIDITLDSHYSALCGYTDTDVEHVFAAELDGLDRAQMRRWYNGYNWGGQAVYNPFDLLLLFENRLFRPWWFETGTPAFLVKLLAERGFYTPQLANMHSDADLLGSFEVEHISSEALLFQTGYLTITASDEPVPGMLNYTLGYPNLEVQTCLNKRLLNAYTGNASQNHQQRQQLVQALRSHNMDALCALFRAFFAAIPYNWYSNNPISQYEGFYASVVYSHFAALGFDLLVEDATNLGRIDLTLKLPEHIYLFEFKVVESEPGGKALQQLKERAYADKFRQSGLPISLVGVEFSREQRNVTGFEVLQLANDPHTP